MSSTALLQLLRVIIILNAATLGSSLSYCSTPVCADLGNFVSSSLNQNASACQDFYEYACSSKSTQKEDALKQVEDQLIDQIEKLLREPKDPAEPVAVHKAKDMYSACTNEAARNQHGNAQLHHFIQNEFGGWPIVNHTWTAKERRWEEVAGKTRKLGYSILLRLNVNLDLRNRNQHIIELDRARAEYTPDLPDHLLNYLSFVATQSNMIHDSAVLLGATAGEVLKEDIKAMLHFQLQLNKLLNRNNDIQNQNHKLTYDVLTIKRLSEITHHYDLQWMTMFNATFDSVKVIRDHDEVVVLDVEYIKHLATLLKNTNNKTIINYLIWRVVKDVIEDGDSNMMAVNPELRGSGLKTRSDICMKEVKGFLGYSVTHLYIKHNDKQRQLEIVSEVVDTVKATFTTLIHNSTWMDSSTKALAITKLRSMSAKIGYPSWIMDSKNLDLHYERAFITHDNHFANILSLSFLYSLQELELVNLPFNKSSWATSPLMVNAFYHRTCNEIYIPVAILQRPFVDPDWPMVTAFGGIGSIIGHEITHGFDDESLIVAANGSLIHWWTSSTTPRYKEATQCVTKHYDRYCLNIESEQRNVCVDGQRTLKENVADIGGLKASFHAYEKWKNNNAKRSDSVPILLKGFTNNQLFFLSFAQIWCTSANSSMLLKQIRTSSNSPNKYRLLGAVSNMNSFKRVFQCPTLPGDDSSCNIW